MMQNKITTLNGYTVERRRAATKYWQAMVVLVCGVLIGVCTLSAIIMAICTRWPIAGVVLERSGIILFIAINVIVMIKLFKGQLK